MLEKEVLNLKKQPLIVTQNQSEEKLKEYLDELEFNLYGRWTSSQTFFTKMERPNPKTFVEQEK
jgi:GTP-binding protein HflX